MGCQTTWTTPLQNSPSLRNHYNGAGMRCSILQVIGLAVGSRKGTIYVWNFEEPEHPIQLTGHTDHTWSVVFSPDGKRLISGADDNTARVWDVELGEEIAILPIGEPCTPMGFAFSPCGDLIVGGLDNEIRFWCAKQLTTIRIITKPDNNRRTYALAFSPCGKYLASGTWWQEGMEKMAIRIWDVCNRREYPYLLGT